MDQRKGIKKSTKKKQKKAKEKVKCSFNHIISIIMMMYISHLSPVVPYWLFFNEHNITMWPLIKIQNNSQVFMQISGYAQI